VRVTLARRAPGSAAAWEQVAAGRTNKDGRVPDLLPPADWVQPGHYRITWDTAGYMDRCSAEHPAFFTPARRFYPSVSVEFEIQQHQVGLQGEAKEPGGLPPASREEQAPAWGSGAAATCALTVRLPWQSCRATRCAPLPQCREHFHVPLTWNPFGYSTYRGS
jgi:5-hydroxyisourate hydrolase/2-oxo-4-hydroxy-4-carboxy-5-ureidoimidazoline decarboxylase